MKIEIKKYGGSLLTRQKSLNHQFYGLVIINYNIEDNQN